MKGPKSLSELQFYVNLLEDINGKKKYNNYDSLKEDLLIEFGIKTTRQELNELYEPNLTEAKLDLKLIYGNL